MFWKLVLTIAIVALIAGRTPSLRNPLVRLLLPRSWAVGLSMLPAARRAPPPKEEAPPRDGSRFRIGRDGRLLLLLLVLVGVAAWMATRAMITRQADAGVSAPAR